MTVNLMHGDCLELMKTIPDGSVDLIVASPPCGIIACKWDIVIPFKQMWNEINRVIKPNCATVLITSQPFTSSLIMSNIENFKYSWIWSKNKCSGHLNAKIMPMKYHEDIVVFSNGKARYYPQDTKGHAAMNYAVNNQNNINGKHNGVVTEGGKTDRKPRSIIECDVVNNDGSNDGGRFHPSQKPIALIEYLIKTYTIENENVLDFTMGSGTTGFACINTNRNFTGIELDDNYFKIATNRINSHIKSIPVVSEDDFIME